MAGKTWLTAFLFVSLAVHLKAQSCTWIQFDNTHIFGGTENPATSVGTCQSACQSTSGCQGIDWSPGNQPGPRCFLLSTQDNKFPADGVTHYDRICSASTQPTTSTTTLWRVPISSTFPFSTTLQTSGPPTTIGGGSSTNLPQPDAQRDCKTSYEIVPDTSSLGGTPVPEIPDLRACFTACTGLLSCIGFDFSQSTGCWIHTNATSFAKKFYQQGVTQFAVKKCPEEGIMNCTAALNDICDKACFPKWARYENTAGSGGQSFGNSQANNYPGCLEACFKQSNCIGIEWTSIPGSNGVCTYYNTAQQLAMTSTTFKAFVTQYRLLSRCGTYCQSSWLPYYNTRFRTLDATNRTDVTTASGCEQACRLSPTCVLYQFTRTGTFVCTLADSFYEGSNSSTPSITTYIFRLSCNDTSLPSTPIPPMSTTTAFDPCKWIPFNNMNIFGGTADGASSLTACQSSCRNRTNCQGIDWAPGSPAGQQCYLLFTQSGKNQANWNVTHYDLNCTSPSVTQGPTTWSSVAITTVTTLPSTATTNVIDPCKWIPFNNTNIFGGTADGASSLTACQSSCRNRTNCQGIDWAPGNPAGQQCFLLFTQSGKYQPTWNVTHYDLNCNSSSSASTVTWSITSRTSTASTTVTPYAATTTSAANTTTPANCTFTPYNNTIIYGGQDNPALTLDDCKAACLANVSCQSIDWALINPPGRQCFLHPTQNGKYPSSNAVHYDRSCTAGCTLVSYKDMNVYGGTGNPATTLSECQGTCLATSNCKGFDWVPNNPPGQRCFTFTFQGQKFAAPGVTHYDLFC